MARFITLCLVVILAGQVSLRTVNQQQKKFLITFLREYFCTGNIGWSDKVDDPVIKLFSEVNIQNLCLESEDIINFFKSINRFALARKSTTKTCGRKLLLKSINDFTNDPSPLVDLGQKLCEQTSKPDKCYGAPVWAAMRKNIKKKAAHGGRSKRQFSPDTMLEFLNEVYSSGDTLVDDSIYPEIVHKEIGKFVECLVDKRNDENANRSFQMKTHYLLLKSIVAIVFLRY